MRGLRYIGITHRATNDLSHSLATTAFDRPGFAAPARTFFTHKVTNDKILSFPSGQFSSFSLGKIQGFSKTEDNLCNVFINNRLRSIYENYPSPHDWFPPYMGNSSSQLYPHFYLSAIKVANIVSMIFPIGWQKPCTGASKGLARMNTPEIKGDKQIVFIDNRHNVFPGVAGAAETNIILWKKGYDNGLDGMQLLYNDGKSPEEIQLLCEQSGENKPKEIRTLLDCVKKIHKDNFINVGSITSTQTPYGLFSDAFTDVTKYGLEPIVDESPKEANDIKIYGGIGRTGRAIRYVRENYALPKRPDSLSHFKVLFPKQWGNMSENAGLGGAYSDIIIASPNEICTQKYITSGSFNTITEARAHAKFLMSKFCRALLYMHKLSKGTVADTFGDVPLQDYSEPWWSESISQIDEHLFEKYDVPSEIRDFVRKHIQTRTEENIINL